MESNDIRLQDPYKQSNGEKAQIRENGTVNTSKSDL